RVPRRAHPPEQRQRRDCGTALLAHGPGDRSVKVVAGAMQLTRIPYLPSSIAACRVSVITPASAAYDAVGRMSRNRDTRRRSPGSYGPVRARPWLRPTAL